MKKANTIILPEDLLNAIDQTIGQTIDRSEFIVGILRKHISEKSKKMKKPNDLDILNKNSEYLNKEAADVLRYQEPL